MNNLRDILLMSVGIIMLMVFTLFLFDYYLKSEEIKVIQKNVYYDSLLLEEQEELKVKDSIIIHEEKLIEGKLSNHEHRIKKLETIHPKINGQEK